MTVSAAAAASGGRRYALLLALNDSDYARKAYGGYRNVFVDALRSGSDEEAWDCYRVIDGEFPAAGDLRLYDGFVVSGSPHDAHGDEPWVRRLCALLQAVHGMGARVLGVCFGHQVLCRALGGRVGRARGGWDVGVKTVTFVEEDDQLLDGFEFLRGLPRRESASIIEIHQDEVWEVPPRGKVLAYSEKTRVEMFAVGDNVLGIQGHPEYSNDILLNLITRLVNNNTLDRCVGEEARRTAESGEPDREFWTGLCKGFLRGGAGAGRPPPSHEPAPELSCGHHVVARFASSPAAAAPIGL